MSNHFQQVRRLAVASAIVAFAGVLIGQVPVEPDLGLIESANHVGIVYRGPGPEDAARYVEHWILFPSYVDPAPRSLVTLELVPGAGPHFAGESDFFARAPFPARSRYVRAECQEFTELPRRR